MSWDCYLTDLDGHGLEMPDRFEDGGTYALGGTYDCHLNVTYNYLRHFDFSSLDGMVAYYSIPLLESLARSLGTEPDPDYWKATPGNAGRACARLLSFARTHPRGVWAVS